MKTARALFAAFCLVASLSFAAIASAQENPAAAAYKKSCSACHGIKGDGKGPAATAFNPRPTNFSELPDTTSSAYLYTMITKGKKQMPPFEKMLTDDQRKALSNYIRESFIPKAKKK